MYAQRLTSRDVHWLTPGYGIKQWSEAMRQTSLPASAKHQTVGCTPLWSYMYSSRIGYMYVLILSYPTSIIYVCTYWQRSDVNTPTTPNNHRKSTWPSIFCIWCTSHHLTRPSHFWHSELHVYVRRVGLRRRTWQTRWTPFKAVITFTVFNQIYMNQRFHRLK